MRISKPEHARILREKTKAQIALHHELMAQLRSNQDFDHALENSRLRAEISNLRERLRNLDYNLRPQIEDWAEYTKDW